MGLLVSSIRAGLDLAVGLAHALGTGVCESCCRVRPLRVQFIDGVGFHVCPECRP